METVFVTLAAFLVVVGIMSVGILFKRKPIQGSCGGIANIMGAAGCDICEKRHECKLETSHRSCKDEDEECHTHC